MFEQLFYCNREKIDQYSTLLTGQEKMKIDKVQLSGEKTGGLDLQFLKGNKKSIISYEGTVVDNDLLALNIFLEELRKTDNYLDLLDRKIDENYLGRGTIVRLESQFEIPDEFDGIKLLADSKEFGQGKLEEGIAAEDMLLFRQNFSMRDPKVPIKILINEKVAWGKIAPDFISDKTEEIEELAGEDIVILAKVIAPLRDKKREIFNPLKDFFSVKRSLRKNKNIFDSQMPQELLPIYSEEDYVELEILALYQ